MVKPMRVVIAEQKILLKRVEQERDDLLVAFATYSGIIDFLGDNFKEEYKVAITRSIKLTEEWATKNREEGRG